MRTKKDKELHEMIDFLVLDGKRNFTIEEIVNELWKFKELHECKFIHKAYITRSYLTKVVSAKVSSYRKSNKVWRMSKGRYLVL
jgi:hemerythrin